MMSTPRGKTSPRNGATAVTQKNSPSRNVKQTSPKLNFLRGSARRGARDSIRMPSPILIDTLGTHRTTPKNQSPFISQSPRNLKLPSLKKSVMMFDSDVSLQLSKTRFPKVVASG